MIRPISILLASAALAACGGSAPVDEPENLPNFLPLIADDDESIRIERAPAAPEDTDDSELATSNRLAAAGAAAEALAARGVEEIGWEDLMPPGEEEILTQLYQQQMVALYSAAPIEEGSAEDIAIQIGTFNTVPEMNEKKVRLPGYTVPFDFGTNAQITEFLLVPYYGACLHAPPPPPNQTIFAMTDTPIKIKDLAQAVWLEGTIYTQTQESELADAAYTIKVDSVTMYEW
ncbi:MAG: DUF3299 domain-containing protein [Pseudomonadota bacterium]